MSPVTASEARDAFGETLSRVAYAKERVVVSRRGKPLAALVPLEDLRRLEQLDERAGDDAGAAASVVKPTLALLRRNRRQILNAAARHGARDVRIFGSLVREEGETTSDVDILVNFEEEHSLFDHAALVVELEKLLGRSVDVVPERNLRPELRERVLKEALPL